MTLTVDSTRTSPETEPSPSRSAAERDDDGRTIIPDTSGIEIGERRAVRVIRLEERFELVGAAAAAIALATLLFGWLTPLVGAVGWAVVAYLAFLGFYVLLVRLRADRQEVADRFSSVLFASAAVTLFGSLLFVGLFTIVRGSEALLDFPAIRWNFLAEDMRLAGPLDPLDTGGIAHAIIGTLIQISIALAVTVPLGIATAVFLNEVGGPFARFVRTIADAMTALPSIVAGLFVYAAVIVLITQQRSGFAASIAITVMMLPIVIRASDVVLRLVAGNLREAAYALGATRWRTVWHVVLPTARSGLVTAVILGTARGIGETSPVLLTSGVTAVVNTNPFEGPMISLPLQVFDFVRSPETTMIARGFGTATVLLMLVLVLFAIARLIGGRGPGQLTPRQQRRITDASRADLRRMSDASAHRVESPKDPDPSGSTTTAPDVATTRQNPDAHPQARALDGGARTSSLPPNDEETP